MLSVSFFFVQGSPFGALFRGLQCHRVPDICYRHRNYCCLGVNMIGSWAWHCAVSRSNRPRCFALSMKLFFFYQHRACPIFLLWQMPDTVSIRITVVLIARHARKFWTMRLPKPAPTCGGCGASPWLERGPWQPQETKMYVRPDPKNKSQWQQHNLNEISVCAALFAWLILLLCFCLCFGCYVYVSACVDKKL